MVACLAQDAVKGLQSELDDSPLADQAGFPRFVSKSAFSQVREKLSHSTFRALNELLLAGREDSVGVARWHGWRLVAADTTTLHLPETIIEFGVHCDRWGGATPMEVAFGLYDSCYEQQKARKTGLFFKNRGYLGFRGLGMPQLTVIRLSRRKRSRMPACSSGEKNWA